MAIRKRLLVAAIDIDNDLFEKAGVRGPLIGRDACVDGAMKLALADPEDSDSNTIFEAVKTAKELSEEHVVEVCVLTGSSSLGYEADSTVLKQLEKVAKDFHAEACVIVSDGASDEVIIPLINARLRVESIKRVVIKQSKELEKTYFVILEKLKEPHFARIVFGIPAIALLLFAFSEYLGVRLFVGLLGGYLLLKGLGLEERLAKKLAVSRLSLDNVGIVFYFSAVPLTVVALWIAVSAVNSAHFSGETNSAKLAAVFVKDLLLLLPVSLLLVVVGKVLQALSEDKPFLLPRNIVYGASVFLFWLVFNNASDWIIGSVSFADFFYSMLLGITAMFLVVYLAREFKHGIVAGMNLVDKEVYTEIGGLIGKVVGVSKKNDSLFVQTASGQKIDLDFDNISNIGEKIIIKY